MIIYNSQLIRKYSKKLQNKQISLKLIFINGFQTTNRVLRERLNSYNKKNNNKLNNKRFLLLKMIYKRCNQILNKLYKF